MIKVHLALHESQTKKLEESLENWSEVLHRMMAGLECVKQILQREKWSQSLWKVAAVCREAEREEEKPGR